MLPAVNREADILGGVTLEEALAELGLEAGANPEAVRRAYLRLIKIRKPESDPQGFKRAREAYEIARPDSELQAFALKVEQRHEPPAPPTAPPPPVNEEGAPEVELAFERFAAEWQAVPMLDRFKRLKIARAAVAARPDDRRAHWMLVSTLSGFMGDAQLAQALRDGYKAGFEEFLEALLIRLPDAATRAEVSAALASPTASLRLRGAAVGATWDTGRSADFVVDLCGQAHAADSAQLPVGPLLEIVFALHEVDAAPDALRAHEAVRRVLRENELELRLVRGELAVIWRLAEELASLPDDFPERLRRAFATASRAGDLWIAFHDAYDLIRGHRDQIARWTKRLPATTNVAGVLRAALAHDTAITRWRLRSMFRSTWYLLLIPVALLIVRACAR